MYCSFFLLVDLLTTTVYFCSSWTVCYVSVVMLTKYKNKINMENLGHLQSRFYGRVHSIKLQIVSKAANNLTGYKIELSI